MDSLSSITIRNSVIFWLPLKGNTPGQHMTCVETPAPSVCRLIHVTASRFPSVTMHQRSKTAFFHFITFALWMRTSCFLYSGYYSVCMLCPICAKVVPWHNGSIAGVHCVYELSSFELTSSCTKLLPLAVTHKADIMVICPISFLHYWKRFLSYSLGLG